MKKIFRNLHLWLSVPFGLILSLICFSGAALVFENEITELCRHNLYYVQKVESAPLPIEVLLNKVEETLPQGTSVAGVSVFSHPKRTYQVNLSPGRRASIYIDPYTGEIKGQSERIPFFYTMFRLHRFLLDKMNPNGGIFWGRVIVGVSTLVLIFILLTGILIWWPRTKKVLKKSLKIKCTKGWRRLWHDLHVAGGMYALIFLLIMALTGLTWSFSWYREGFYKVFGAEVPPRSGGHAAAHGKGKGKKARIEESPSYIHWQQVYEELRAETPHFKSITISEGSAAVTTEHYGNQRASDRYKFNPHSGEITESTLYKDAVLSNTLRGWIYSVHVGSWGGMLTRILSFMGALLGAILPLTGYYLWWRRLKSKKKRRK